MRGKSSPAYPALFTRTSMRPKFSCPALTAARTALLSATSRASGKTLGPCCLIRWSSCEGVRQVAITFPPDLRAASVMTRPRPREQPVMNQTLVMLGISCAWDRD